MNYTSYKNRGFTLIELLLVVGIIIIIASLVIVSVSTARMRGRDAKRVADLSSIRLALEMYRDANGKYPATRVTSGTTWVLSNETDICIVNCEYPSTSQDLKVRNWSDLQIALGSYLTPLPKDPLDGKEYTISGSRKPYAYWYGATTTNYKLRVYLEENTDAMLNTNDGGIEDNHYEIYTIGAKDWGGMIP